MANIRKAIADIAVANGYEGGEPQTIISALDALTDTLAGDDEDEGASVEGAIKALASYIGGGGGRATADVWLWNVSGNREGVNTAMPSKVGYVTAPPATQEEQPTITDLEFEQVTDTYQGTTYYGVSIKDVPLGAPLLLTFNGFEQTFMSFMYSTGYDLTSTEMGTRINDDDCIMPMPFDGTVISGVYSVIRTA